MDRQPAHLAAEGTADRVPDRGIDLPRDLRDGQAVGDGQLQLDVEAALQFEPKAGPSKAERLEDAAGKTASEAGHAIRAERRGTDDVGDRSAADDGSAGRRIGGHLGDVLLGTGWPAA